MSKLILVLILYCPPLILATRPFILEFESLKVEFDSKFMKNMTMQLIDHNGRKVMNGSFILWEDLMEFNIVTSLRAKRANGKPWSIFNVTLNGCDILGPKGVRGNPVAVAYLNEVQRFMPSLPKKCPLKKNVYYSLNNLCFNEDAFPLYLPENTYFVFFGVSRKNVFITKFHIVGLILAKNGEKYRKMYGKTSN